METNPEIRKEPYGIGGWLILVLIGLVLSPVRLIYLVVSTVVTLGDTDVLTGETGLKALITGEMMSNLTFAILAVFLLILMLRKNRLFPSLMIGFYLVNLVVVLVDFILAGVIVGFDDLTSSSIFELARSVVGCAIWVPYFIYSKRVKNTFLPAMQAGEGRELTDKTRDIIIFTVIAFWFMSHIITFVLTRIVENWYETAIKFINISLNVVFSVIPFTIAILTKNRLLRLFAIILAVLLFGSIIYSNTEWLLTSL